MDQLIVPPNANWFMKSLCSCTPDNGLLYGAMKRIAYIPPKTKAGGATLKMFDLKSKLSAFTIDPDWSETKRFAVVNGSQQVLVMDFETGQVIKGHKGHCTEKPKVEIPQTLYSAIAFANHNTLISSTNSNVINYCLPTNTFKVYLDLSSRNPITILKQSPDNSNMMAAGTKNGLILLIAIDKMEIVARLRGHDTEITSLEWITFSSQPNQEKEPDSIALKSAIATATADSAELFDIYSYDDTAEFGVYREATEDGSDDEVTNEAEIQEKIQNNSNFDFLEACNELKGDILANGCSTSSNSGALKGTFEENKDKYGIKNDENPSIDESMESNASSHTPVLTEESLNFLDEYQRMKDFVKPDKQDLPNPNQIAVLASGSREPVVWMWNVNERIELAKIKWHPKPKPLLPAAFTNVLWIGQKILLITDSNGDLVEYKIAFDSKKKSVTSEKQERTFDAKGILNLCKSNDESVVWALSIHRNISCLETSHFSKIISLDTIQLRIHYIVENPIDSNVIAIGGNDKRICLWNTSETDCNNIVLRPFMNKIHSCVLCLSWHPAKENILAFSTREGRIGLMDTNKSSNVPIILPSFSSQEIYSMSWGRYQSNGNEVVILMACNGEKLVYYQHQKDQWHHHNIETVKHSCSVAANGKLLAVGTKNGEVSICDMSEEFKVLANKKICRKYIGMMTWSQETLAIATENGIVLIKDITEAVTEIVDSQVIKLSNSKRVFSARFNKSGSLLVTCCQDGIVKVWNLHSYEACSSIIIDTPAFAAIFLPSNEKILLCGGQDSTVLAYEWHNYNGGVTQEVATNSQKNPQATKNVHWAEPNEIISISKNTKRRHKKKISVPAVDSGDGSISELSSDVKKLILHPKKSSIFHQANRELISSPLEFMEIILKGSEREPSLNEQIFQSREGVKNVIDNELQQYRLMNMKSYGGVILPQLNDSLKIDLMERIVNKSLTETHVAVAPSVSFDLWRKCCLAFGKQCIENEDHLGAIPYFLAISDIDSCINQLIEGKFFREAWIIAKMRKEDGDPIFDKIFSMWIVYYDSSGNYEAGAALLTCRGDFAGAIEMLNKRLNKTEKCAKILELLYSKTLPANMN